MIGENILACIQVKYFNANLESNISTLIRGQGIPKAKMGFDEQFPMWGHPGVNSMKVGAECKGQLPTFMK